MSVSSTGSLNLGFYIFSNYLPEYKNIRSIPYLTTAVPGILSTIWSNILQRVAFNWRNFNSYLFCAIFSILLLACQFYQIIYTCTFKWIYAMICLANEITTLIDILIKNSSMNSLYANTQKYILLCFWDLVFIPETSSYWIVQ